MKRALKAPRLIVLKEEEVARRSKEMISITQTLLFVTRKSIFISFGILKLLLLSLSCSICQRNGKSFSSHLDFLLVFSSLYNLLFQVFLLLVKRLASLHYNHPQDLPQESSSSLKSLVKATTRDGSFLTINNCQPERDCNTNHRSKTVDADYDEVDFQSTADYNHGERINETIDESSRTHKNMGSNVSTAGGKGLSGRRTQSSSKCRLPSLLICKH